MPRGPCWLSTALDVNYYYTFQTEILGYPWLAADGRQSNDSIGNGTKSEAKIETRDWQETHS